MRGWRSILSWRPFSQRRRREQDLQRELRADLDLEAEEQREAGVSLSEARYAAQRSFGNVTSIQEEVRHAWGWPPLETISQDLRLALRTLRRTPGFTAAVVLMLALGIGTNTAIFSVVNAVLLRPLPYPDPDRLVKVWETNPRANRWGQWVSFPDYLDYRGRTEVFDEVAAFRGWAWTITGGDHPERLRGLLVTASLFPTLGVQPLLGRSFLPEEDQPDHEPVVILGYELWQNRFGADAGLLGQDIILDGQNRTVIGVMPPGFQFPLDIFEASAAPNIWVPVAAFAERRERGSHNFRVIGRLNARFSVEQAQAGMQLVANSIGEEDADHRGRSVNVAGLLRTATAEVRPSLLLLLGAIGLVLLIACANVANLQLARATARQRETAIRQALGASRRRLVRQFLTESTLVALLAGALGLALAGWGVRILIRLGPAIPRLQETTMDPLVVGFTVFLSLATGILFGLAPAIRGSRADLTQAVNETGARSTASGGQTRSRKLLVVAEIALALMVLIGAGLLIRSFVLLQNVDLGFNPQNVLTAHLAAGEDVGPAGQTAFFKQVIERIAALPGVEAVGAATAVPLRGNDGGAFQVEGQPAPQPGDAVIYAEIPRVTPGYFRAMKIDLLKGREFTWSDDEHGPLAAIVNETLARQYWPADDPVGKRLSISNRDGQPIWRQIVGIARDTKFDNLQAAMRPMIYVPLPQAPRSAVTVAVRVQGDPLDITGAFRQAVTAVRNDRPLFAIETMEQVISDSLATRRFQTFLLGIFAAVALVLAAVGIYAVVAYSVTQRTHEIGIRMALGARQADILRRTLSEGLSMALSGVAIGLAASLALCQALSGLLYAVSATDPLTFVAVPGVLLVVALLASYIPARRATTIDPIIALRHE